MLHELLALSRAARGFSFRFALVAALPLSVAAQSAWITRVAAPADGTYDRSVSLMFTLSFSAPVFVQGEPRLPVQVGNATRYATLAPTLSPAATGATALTFEYVPAAADADNDGIVVGNAVDLNGGAIVAADAAPALLTFAPLDTRGVNIAAQRPPSPNIVAARAGGAKGDALVLSGTADGNSLVLITRENVGLIGATIAAANGAWTFEYAGAQVGTMNFSAVAENLDGILSPQSSPFSVTIVHTAENTRVGERTGL